MQLGLTFDVLGANPAHLLIVQIAHLRLLLRGERERVLAGYRTGSGFCRRHCVSFGGRCEGGPESVMLYGRS